MARQRVRDEDESEVNLTPMMDVVFILLIFFIVTASFVKESGIEVRRPGAKSARSKGSAGIFIAVTQDGEVWIDKHRVDVRQVAANVEKLRAENPQASVVIQADKDAKVGLVVQVRDAVSDTGVAPEDVSVAATPE